MTSFKSNIQSQTNQMDFLSYRGFSSSDILTLSEKDGQGEAMSEFGSTGLWAAIEWIDNYYDKHGNYKQVGNKRVMYPKAEFNWYGWDRFYADLCDRSVKGTNKLNKGKIFYKEPNEASDKKED
jgi:hypothetical protein